ncbi:MAG: hypothetical protein NC432_14980 [Roseburia sp.]|nr:hypothetical protein [Roseburia sp.]MCM1099677.1 hypothetical protein [Ruminococcus flavefaciens]
MNGALSGGESGFFKQKWGFVQAVEAAGDGDIVELEEEFCPFNEQKNKSITVTRSITIEGHPNSNGALTNIIDGVIVKNGATVTLKNLEVRKNADKCNNINEYWPQPLKEGAEWKSPLGSAPD